MARSILKIDFTKDKESAERTLSEDPIEVLSARMAYKIKIIGGLRRCSAEEMT